MTVRSCLLRVRIPQAATKIITHEFVEDAVVFDEGGVKVTADGLIHYDQRRAANGRR